MKHILSAALVLTAIAVQAQDITDALRYSVDDMNGTARFKAMSGAFGALGGDLSAININPAGSAVFSGSEFGITIGNQGQKSVSKYFGREKTKNDSDFDATQLGVVLIFPTGDADWKKVSLSFNYQKTRNFDGKDIAFGGTSDKNLGDYFAYYANGKLLSDLIVDKSQRETIESVYRYLGRERGYGYQQAFLGYHSYLLNPGVSSPTNTSYSSSVAGGSTAQEYEKETQGGVRKYNFNIATQYGDQIYLGLNLNSHNVNYLQKTYLREHYTNGNTYLHNELKTTGSGFSFQLGALAKITQNVRLGVTYESPTWYTLHDETWERIETTLGTNTYVVNPNINNVYEDYKFRTPSSWTASFAYTFGKIGLVSLDYIYKGYQGVKFRSDFVKELNKVIDETLGDTSALRAGVEFRIPFKVGESTNYVSLRGGYRYEQSPYRRGTAMIGDLNGYSLGMGCTLGGIRLDVSYDVAHQDNHYQMYTKVLNTPASIQQSHSNLLFTFTTRLF